MKPKKKKDMKGKVLYLRDLPPQLKAVFHANCTRRQSNMTAVMLGMMRLYCSPEDGLAFRDAVHRNMRKRDQ